MNGCKRGNCCSNRDGSDGPKCHGDCNEEQESRPLVREGVREATAPVHHKCRKLIHNFNRDNDSCPQPEPLRQFEYRQEQRAQTRYEADVCKTIQQCSSPSNALQSPGQPPVGYVADATDTIDYPERHTRHITKKHS